MLTEEKALYQVKLILDYLPKEEYKLIPQDEIDYIEDNFEYDENIVIDPSIPLEDQIIDSRSYKILDKVLKKIEENKEINNSKEIKEYVNRCKNENENYNEKLENIQLKNIIESLQKENEKLPKAKD